MALTVAFDLRATPAFAGRLVVDLTGSLAERAEAVPFLAVPDRTDGSDLRRLAVRLAGRFAMAGFAANLRFGEIAALPPGGAALLRRRVSFAMLSAQKTGFNNVACGAAPEPRSK